MYPGKPVCLHGGFGSRHTARLPVPVARECQRPDRKSWSWEAGSLHTIFITFVLRRGILQGFIFQGSPFEGKKGNHQGISWMATNGKKPVEAEEGPFECTCDTDLKFWEKTSENCAVE